MRRKTVVTTGEVAAHCQVSYETVHNWIRAGHLNAHVTPGRRHRIVLDEFRRFLTAHGMPPYEMASPRKRKLLVVDDEAVLVKTITEFFEATGEYECAAAGDGFEAGLLVLTFGPDLVLLDLRMPQMDGFQVCRRLKSDPKTQPIQILVMTAYPEDGHLDKARACGADECLVKPFTLEALKQTVEALFEQHARRSRAVRTG